MNVNFERHGRRGTKKGLREDKVRKLVADRDEEQILQIVSRLRRSVRRKSKVLRHQADIAANLRHAFMETELDRDRLQRMVKELYELCISCDLQSEADEITERYGGIAGPGEANFIG